MDSFSSQADDVSMSSGGMYGIAIGGPGAMFHRASNSVPVEARRKITCFPKIEIPTL